MDHQGQPPFPEPTEITQGSQFLAYLPSSPVSPHRNHRKWWFPVSLCLLTGLVPGPPCGPHSDGSQGRPLPITGHCLSTVPGTSRPGLGGMAVPGDRHAPSPFIPRGRSAPSVFRTDRGLKHGHSLFLWCHPMMPSFCTLPLHPLLGKVD